MSDLSQSDTSATEETSIDAETDASSEVQDEQLEESGLKALEAWKQRAKKAEKAAKESSVAAKERDELRARLEELEGSSKSEVERQLEQAIQETEQRVRAELESSFTQRLVSAEVRSVASGVLTDPEDAIRFLDISEFEMDEDGNLDSKAIKEAVNALVKQRPYLAGKTRPKGDVDQGARKEGEVKTTPGLGTLQKAYSQAK